MFSDYCCSYYKNCWSQEKKIQDFNKLVKKPDYDSKIKDSEWKFFTASDYDKFTSDIIDAMIKPKKIGQWI